MIEGRLAAFLREGSLSHSFILPPPLSLFLKKKKERVGGFGGTFSNSAAYCRVLFIVLSSVWKKPILFHPPKKREEPGSIWRQSKHLGSATNMGWKECFLPVRQISGPLVFCKARRWQSLGGWGRSRTSFSLSPCLADCEHLCTGESKGEKVVCKSPV